MTTQVAVEPVSDVDSSRWSEFVASRPDASLYHDYAWRAVINRVFGCDTFYLAAVDPAGSWQGVLPLVQLRSMIFGHFLVSLPYFSYGGVLASSSQAGVALVDAAGELGRQLGVDHVELRHVEDSFPDLPKREEKASMRLQLPNCEEKLWQGLKSKVRAQVKRPSREGASHAQGGLELVDEFYRVFSRNMRDLGTPVYPKKLMREVLVEFPDAARVFVVRLGGEPVAAGLVLKHRDTVEIPWASSLRESNRLGVNMALYWDVLRWAISEGAHWFDFGRCTIGSGTFNFKKQWGAKPTKLYWHYLLPAGAELPMINPDNPKYALLVKLWQRQPVAIANVLGPRIVKNLP